ncbi:MAG: cupredoxin domain-containing protein [Anaerolineales bacterium]|nr:cupredoxin domain-containing protein [Anaerolineales bacterium]
MAIKKVLPVFLAVLLSACAGGQSVSKVTVTMSEFAFEPASITVTAGQPVEITLANDGAIEHDFAIEVIPAKDVSTEGSMSGHDSSDQHAEFDLHTATGSGETSVLRFTPTQPGTYKIICSVPGHLDAGMTGELIVK